MKVRDGLLGNESAKDGSDEAEVVQLHLKKEVDLSATFNVGKVFFPSSACYQCYRNYTWQHIQSNSFSLMR